MVRRTAIGKNAVILRLRISGLVEVLPTNNDAEPLYTCWIQQLDISSRLANTSRYIRFPDGQTFETLDNDGIDLINKQIGGVTQQWLYRLESHWRYVFVALLVLIGSAVWFVNYGVPMATKALVLATPQSWIDQAGDQTLRFFDEQLMSPSSLDEGVRKRVSQYFEPIIAEHSALNIQLLFRDSDIGANAFALPNGTIIFTDDIIMAANIDDELLSVMAHEIGHIHHRHGARGIVQSSLFGFSLMLIAGDASAAAEIFLGIPVLLSHLGYYRDFEREADDYALDYIRENNIDPAHFSRLMTRIRVIECTKNELDRNDSPCLKDSPIQRYWSTHPGLAERIKKFER